MLHLTRIHSSQWPHLTVLSLSWVNFAQILQKNWDNSYYEWGYICWTVVAIFSNILDHSFIYVWPKFFSLFLKAYKRLGLFSFYWKFKCKIDLNIPNQKLKVPYFCDKQELKNLMLIQRGLLCQYCPKQSFLSTLCMQLNFRNW